MSDPSFRADTLESDGEIVLSLFGQIDMLSAPNFAAAAIGVGGSDARVVFDMAGVTFMDSAGLSVVAGTMRRLERSGGSLCLRDVSRQVRQILRISGLDQLVTIEESLGTAPGAARVK
jgi:anti-anti-sigma factor